MIILGVTDGFSIYYITKAIITLQTSFVFSGFDGMVVILSCSVFVGLTLLRKRQYRRKNQ